VRSSVARVGTWSSSNAWVNRIHNITVEAIEANLQSVLTDCPHRERLGWLEVSHLMAPSIAFNFDISRLWSKIARDTVDAQQPDGLVPDIAPEYTVFSGGFRDSPEWGSAVILNPFWLHALYGDTDTLNATYAAGVRYADYLLSRVEPATGLLAYGLGDWIPVVASPAGVTATGTLVQDLRALAAAAAALGRGAAAAANFSALADAAGAAFERAFFNGAPGADAYPTQCAAGYALALNTTADAAAARAYLLRDVRARGNVTTSGEVGNRYALLALGALGAEGVAAVWDSLLRADAPGYGWMLTMGETALAESWFDASGMSHLHAMYGHVDEFLFAHVAGLRQAPGSVGWARVCVRPALPRGLDWLDVAFDSPKGLLRVAFNVTAHAHGALTVRLSVTVPTGVRASIQHPLDARGERILHVSGGGTHVLTE
jgi:alpha-L-rhamnosidase